MVWLHSWSILCSIRCLSDTRFFAIVFACSIFLKHTFAFECIVKVHQNDSHSSFMSGVDSVERILLWQFIRLIKCESFIRQSCLMSIFVVVVVVVALYYNHLSNAIPIISELRIPSLTWVIKAMRKLKLNLELVFVIWCNCKFADE